MCIIDYLELLNPERKSMDEDKLNEVMEWATNFREKNNIKIITKPND